MRDELIPSLTRLRPRIHTLYVSQGRTVLAADPDGFISGGMDHGLFVHETRLLSYYHWRVNGEELTPSALANVEQHSWLGYYIIVPPGAPKRIPDQGSGQVQYVAEQTLEFRLSRYVGEGMHEDIDITNYSNTTTSFLLELKLDGDFADLLESGGNRTQTGQMTRSWRSLEEGVWELQYDYHAQHRYQNQSESGEARFSSGVITRIERADSPPTYAPGAPDQILFHVQLEPGQIWHTCLRFTPVFDGMSFSLAYNCRSFFGIHNEFDRKRERFLAESAILRAPQSETLTQAVLDTLEQARRDLAALRLYDLDHGDTDWVMSAGLPIYVALFGRDTITTSWQMSLLGAGPMRGTLLELPKWQGTEFNDWRDEQPGKMLHEAHTGPLEKLNYNPRSRYYGSISTSGLYPLLASEYWHWTGNRETIEQILEPMFGAIRWMDNYGDLDQDGFYEYLTRSEMGTKHQAWKDSRDAIVDELGNEVEPPIATCEEQGFVYIAKLYASEMLWWLDRTEEAEALYNQAQELKKRFHDAFWMPDEKFYALGLDAEKRQIRAIASNPGHLIATGIAADEVVRTIGQRLFEPDLFTGWGIRTLSSKNPAYNPYSYHRGSVWPVEHGTFSLGFARYGMYDLVEKISHAQFRAAALFEHRRLPELFSGHGWDEEHPFPAFYLQANSPQSWSASSVFCHVQALLGLHPYAPLNALFLDPHLPPWLPEITIEGLQVGQGTVSLRCFRKEDGDSEFTVLDSRGEIQVLRASNPWPLLASSGKRLKDHLMDLLSGRDR
jgi:glycogen debranching enzyme